MRAKKALERRRKVSCSRELELKWNCSSEASTPYFKRPVKLGAVADYWPKSAGGRRNKKWIGMVPPFGLSRWSGLPVGRPSSQER